MAKRRQNSRGMSEEYEFQPALVLDKMIESVESMDETIDRAQLNRHLILIGIALMKYQEEFANALVEGWRNAIVSAGHENETLRNYVEALVLSGIRESGGKLV